MPWGRWVLCALAFVLATLGCSAAQADEDGDVEKLFKEAVQAMLAGRFESACPAIAEAYRRTEKPGALYTLAECEAKWGKSTAALSHYRQFLGMFAAMSRAEQKRNLHRHDVSTRQVAALRNVVARVTVSLPPEAPEGTVVKRDDDVLDARTFGVATTMDPGKHRFTVELPSGETRSHDVLLPEGEEIAVRLKLPATKSETATDATTPDGESSDGGAWLTTAYVVGAVGIAGIALGVVTGAIALSAKGTVDDNCVDNVCTAEGIDADKRRTTFGHTSTVGFAVGGAALAVGIVLWLTAPDEDAADSDVAWHVTAGDERDPTSVVFHLRRVW